MTTNRRRFGSTEEIAEYIIQRKMRKSAFGGFKCADVYANLKELQVIYKEFTEDQLEEKDRLLEEKDELIRKYEKALQKERRKNEQLQERSQEADKGLSRVLTPMRRSGGREEMALSIDSRRLSVLLQELEIGLDEANLKIKGMKDKLDTHVESIA